MKARSSPVDIERVLLPKLERSMQRELNVLALHKGNEHFLFIYDDASVPSLVDVFRRYATDEEISFNWFDAAVMTEKCKTQIDAQAPTACHVPRFPAEAA
ncbi:MAG TPA: hypothetical protein PKA06_11430 [Gemmatales bacterium]|nr:hypothetical protein [Gemmatales bacterium]HMP17295.1 hypothetical protein [Gemmatales bacterium]